MNVKIEWRSNVAYVGPHRVAVVYYNPREAPKHAGPYLIYCYLPGGIIPDNVKAQSTLFDAQKVVEMVIQRWFEAIK